MTDKMSEREARVELAFDQADAAVSWLFSPPGDPGTVATAQAHATLAIAYALLALLELATPVSDDMDDRPGQPLDPFAALLADTPSAEPQDRDADIARIERVILDVDNTSLLVFQRAAALYDAGLRPSAEPAGLDVERCPSCGDDTPDEACGDRWHWDKHLALRPSAEPLDVARLAKALEVWRERVYVDPDNPGAWYRDSAKAIAAEYARLLPTQASDSPDDTEGAG